MVKKAKRNLEKARNHILTGSKDVLGQMGKNLESMKLRRKTLLGKLTVEQRGKIAVHEKEEGIREELETLRKQEKVLIEKESEIKRSISDLEKKIEKLSKVYSELEHIWK